MKLFPSERQISASETAQMLGISESSVKNWVRHGFIETIKSDKDILFLENDIITLRSRILSGDLKRLNSRANKSNSSRTFLPDELFKSSEEKRAVSEISSFIMRHNIPSSSALFFLSLNLLKRRGMLDGTSPEALLNSPEISIRNRKFLSAILKGWRDSLSGQRPEFFEILKADLPDHSNISGIIYQSILAEGDKSKHGLYYTPDNVVAEIVDRIALSEQLFLDPCCGTGQFLLAFADKTDRPENIYGIDIDPVAVNVARINLLMKFPRKDFNPRVYCADTLLDFNETSMHETGKPFPVFDCIATNPPWGSHFNRKEIKHLESVYPEIQSAESFSYFMVKSLRMLKDGGVLSFVLPESILNVKIHGDIRDHIFRNYHISRIEQKKKIFKNVFSPAAVLDVRNNRCGHDVEIVNSRETFHVSHERFGRNSNCVFDINISTADQEIIDRIYSIPHLTLKDKAVWALGIVTGNNPEYVKDRKNRWNEPVIKGKDILPFKIKTPDRFIKLEPEKFQQMADISFYRCSEKLVYKFISNRLIFACDRESRVTLNSANIVIPEIEGVDIRIIMALFNSELYQYIFQKRFSSVKVLRSHLEELPVPLLGEGLRKSLIRLADDIEAGGAPNRLNEQVYKIFRLSGSEIDYIKSRII